MLVYVLAALSGLLQVLVFPSFSFAFLAPFAVAPGPPGEFGRFRRRRIGERPGLGRGKRQRTHTAHIGTIARRHERNVVRCHASPLGGPTMSGEQSCR